MRVSIVSHSLSNNCLGRAHVLAEILDGSFEVEVAGPVLGKKIWEPLADERSYTKLETNASILEFPKRVRRVADQLQGDVIIAVKPRMTSFGIGLFKKHIYKKPLILDIDDWELGFEYEGTSRIREHLKGFQNMNNVNTINYTFILENLASGADDLIVSNSFLQKQFGGTIVPHVRDTDLFDPDKYCLDLIKNELGLPQDHTIVMFSGTPRQHKGIENLIYAISGIRKEDIFGVIVGVDDSEYSQYLRKIAGENIRFVGRQPFSEIPKWVAAADIITIPQKRSQATRGQLPAKLFDAMAMGKPIIGTNVSDIPKILEGCGIVVESDSSDAIAEEITRLHENPALREELGRKARERCVEEYSYDAYEPVLEGVIENAIKNHIEKSE